MKKVINLVDFKIQAQRKKNCADNIHKWCVLNYEDYAIGCRYCDWIKPKPAKNEKGFTLIECLMVVAILGILSSMALPALTIAGKMVRRLEDATLLAIKTNEETVALNSTLIRVCEVGDECAGKALICLKTSKIKACTPDVPCEFLDGGWEHANQPCDEGVLSINSG